MKLPTFAWVVLAGGILTWIAVRSTPPAYTPLDLEAPPEEISTRLTGEVGPADTVRVFDVKGMCCNGCASKLADRLSELDEVRESAVDVLGEEVSVIVDAGYPVDGLLTVLNTEKYTATLKP